MSNRGRTRFNLRETTLIELLRLILQKFLYFVCLDKHCLLIHQFLFRLRQFLLRFPHLSVQTLLFLKTAQLFLGFRIKLAHVAAGVPELHRVFSCFKPLQEFHVFVSLTRLLQIAVAATFTHLLLQEMLHL